METSDVGCSEKLKKSPHLWVAKPPNLGRLMDTIQYEDKVSFWKAKAKAANKEKRRIKRECARLLVSRDSYKAEVKTLKATVRAQKQEQSVKLGQVSTLKAKGHQFPISLVLFCVQCQCVGTTSLRTGRHCIIQMYLMFGLNFKVPSHNSIRNWACKCGYYRSVAEADMSFEEMQKPWVLWVDESITIGGQKLLLVLGRTAEDWSFECSPTQSSVHVKYIGISEKWKSEDILAELDKISKRHKIAYIVSDNGNNLLGTYKLGSYEHISDITHTLSKALERIFAKDPSFVSMMQAGNQLRRKWNLSKEKSCYMPPCQRGKMRFANIFPTILWAKAMLPLIDKCPKAVAEELAFLLPNADLINTLFDLQQVLEQLSILFKKYGFSEANKQKAEAMMAALPDTPQSQKLKASLEKWINATFAAYQRIGISSIFCCSDIIESTFGKFKQKIHANSPFGLTEFALTIANFGKDFTKDEIRLALETIKLKKVSAWRPEIDSIAAKKRKFFKKKVSQEFSRF